MKLNKVYKNKIVYICCSFALASSLISCSSMNNITNRIKQSNERIKPELSTNREWTYEGYKKVSLDSSEIPTEFSNPIATDNEIIFGLQKRGIIALTKSGKEKWKIDISKGADGKGLIKDDTLYMGANDGYVYAIESSTGNIKWKVEMQAPLFAKPLLHEGRLFLNLANDVVVALDAGTGKWLWHYKKNIDKATTIKGNSTPITDGKRIYAGFTDGSLVALEINTGNLIWDKKIHKGGKFTDVDAEGVLVGDNIFIPSYDGSLYSIRKTDGVILWRFDSGSARSVTILGDRIYLSSSDTTVYCLQKDNAKIIWKFALPVASIPSQVQIYKDFAIVSTSENNVYFLNKNSGNFVKKLNFGSGTGFFTNPLISENNMYVLSNFGNLYKIKL